MLFEHPDFVTTLESGAYWTQSDCTFMTTQRQLAGSNANMLLRLANAEAVPVSLGEQPEGAHGGGQMLDGGGFGGWFFWNCCSWISQESWLVEWRDWSDFYWRIRDDAGFFAMLRCCGEPERYEGATGAWGRSFGECGCLVCIRLVASFSKFQYILYNRDRRSLESVCRFRCCFPAFRIARNRLECHRVTSPSEVRNTASVMPITRASTPFLHLSSSTPSVHVTWNQWIHCRWMYIQRWHGDFFFFRSLATFEFPRESSSWELGSWGVCQLPPAADLLRAVEVFRVKSPWFASVRYTTWPNPWNLILICRSSFASWFNFFSWGLVKNVGISDLGREGLKLEDVTGTFW